MTQTEQNDLLDLHKKCEVIRKTAFYAMRDALKMEDSLITSLLCSGYKTKQDAAIGHFKYAQEQIDRLTKEYLKKYPD